MVDTNISIHNFASGELSPKLRGRYDLQIHQNGLERCLNYIVETQGPAKFRPGTRYVLHTRRNNPAVLIPFQFNDQQAYLLEFTEGYMRIYKDEGIIVESDVTISGLTQANPGVVTATSHGYSNGDEVFIYDVAGMTEVNGKSYLVANKTANTFELTDIDGNNVNTSGYTAYSSGGVCQKIVEITTPYLEADLFQLSVAQNADTMYIVHSNHEPRKLTRSSHTSWTLALYTRTSDPFLSKKTITGITQANPGVITSASHGYTGGEEIIIESVAGMTEINSQTYLVVYIDANTFSLTDLDGSAIDTSAYTAYSSAGYASLTNLLPTTVTFYEARLLMAATEAEPEAFWGSRTPDSSGNTRYDDFTTGSNDDDGFKYTIASSSTREVNPIRWMVGTDRFLAIGTFGTIQKVTGNTADEPITPSSINVRPIDFDGVAAVTPVTKGLAVLYSQRGKRIFNSLEYDVLADQYKPVDRNLVADHITAGGVKQIAFQNGRPDISWVVLDDGRLIGLTYKQKEDVSGWHDHETNDGDDEFFSVGVIPRESDFDQVWFVVKRTINGNTRYYIEYMEDEPTYPEMINYFSGEDNEDDDRDRFLRALFEKQKEYVHMDCALTYDGLVAGQDAGAAVTPSAVSGSGITFTASASVFASTDVGREIWKNPVDGVGTGRATITAYTSATEVTCTITEDFDSTTAMAAGSWYLTTDSISGLEHLEGETVKVVTDGAVHSDEVVTSGAITLDDQASKVHIGLGYTGILKTMNMESGAQQGPAQGKIRNIHAVGIKFFNSLGVKFGTGLYNLKEILFRNSDDFTDRPPPLDSTVRYLEYGDNWEREKHVYIIQQQPLPCTVQQLIPFVSTDER